MVVIQAMAMSSGFGGLIRACAAFRAGLSAFTPSPDFETFDRGDDAPQPVMISSIPSATFGFSGAGRLLAIAHETFMDLNTTLDLARLANVPFYVALPDPEKRSIDSFDDEDEARRIEALGGQLLDRAGRNLSLGFTGARRFFGGNQAAFARALGAAMEALERGSHRECVVMGIDSLVTPPLLDSVNAARRLKKMNNPVGMVPGEGGGLLVLSNVPDTTLGAPEVQVHVRSVRLHAAPPSDAEVPSDGAALARCVLEALGPDASEPRFFIADHNGEEHRAREWGLLQMHLRAQREALPGARAWFPVMSFGDLGAASGGVNACLGARALQHGYAPASRCVVVSSSDEGDRSAMVLHAESRA